MKNKTDITIIVDRSTSMMHLISSTIEGFNSFLAEQKKADGEAVLSLVTFHSEVEPIYEAIPIEKAPELNDKSYQVTGCTAMNDAIGFTIQNIGNRLNKMKKEDRPTDVVIAVITDGYENQSKEFAGAAGYKRVADMIKHQQDKYSWDFVFLGANIDVAKVGGGLGISGSASYTYVASAAGTLNAYRGLSKGLSQKRKFRSRGQETNFSFEKIKDDKKEEK